MVSEEIVSEDKPLFEAVTDEELLAGVLSFDEEPPEEVLLVLLFDVEVPGLSCSAPLLTQPVRVAAKAPTRREMKIFFIYVPFLVQTFLLYCLNFKQH